MRILFLSNYFPPYALGGYEQWCAELAEKFRRRGHHVEIVTSLPPADRDPSREEELPAHRSLHLEVEGGLIAASIRFLFSRRRLLQSNLQVLEGIIHSFQPQVALVWGMWNLSRGLPALLERQLADRVVYLICDYWPILPDPFEQHFQHPARNPALGFGKRLVYRLLFRFLPAPPQTVLRLTHPVCISTAVREKLVSAGLPFQHARVVHGGTHAADYAAAGRSRRRQPGRHRLLYAGRIRADKGVTTILRAIARLGSPLQKRLSLDVLGSGEPGFLAELRALVVQERLEGIVRFLPAIPQEEMPVVMAGYDALIFPSEWEEPFSRIILEAMASGMLVIGTLTGGTAEILEDGRTGLAFPAGDANALAGRIRALVEAGDRFDSLARAGQERVLRDFTLDRMAAEIESCLAAVCSEVVSTP